MLEFNVRESLQKKNGYFINLKYLPSISVMRQDLKDYLEISEEKEGLMEYRSMSFQDVDDEIIKDLDHCFIVLFDLQRMHGFLYALLNSEVTKEEIDSLRLVEEPKFNWRETYFNPTDLISMNQFGHHQRVSIAYYSKNTYLNIFNMWVAFANRNYDTNQVKVEYFEEFIIGNHQKRFCTFMTTYIEKLVSWLKTYSTALSYLRVILTPHYYLDSAFSIELIDKNPFPRIFTSLDAYDLFDKLCLLPVDSDSPIAEISYYFHKMKKMNLIYKMTGNAEFLDFLVSHYSTKLPKIKTESKVSSSKYEPHFFRSYNEIFRDEFD
ncbi:hypothetical protein SAMN06298216_4451 [Spirosomataceae bacterium TFI 002]|nr:hypothetical protein SAMN06298216_4451 [Spirosomataceae bacterium TFI 002]